MSNPNPNPNPNPSSNLIVNTLFIKLVGGYNNYTIVIMAVTADFVMFIAVLLYLILTMNILT